MGKALVAACLLFATVTTTGCVGLYSGKPEPKKNPPTIRPPKITEPEIAFVDQCTVNFTAPPTTKRQVAPSLKLTADGNAALQPVAPPAPRPATAPALQATQDAIINYREALLKDPYNAEATLKLALAYDRMLRKGCALAMLRRLETLAASDRFNQDAVPMIDLVTQNPHWFSPYHNEALRAVGH